MQKNLRLIFVLGLAFTTYTLAHTPAEEESEEKSEKSEKSASKPVASPTPKNVEVTSGDCINTLCPKREGKKYSTQKYQKTIKSLTQKALELPIPPKLEKQFADLRQALKEDLKDKMELLKKGADDKSELDPFSKAHLNLTYMNSHTPYFRFKETKQGHEVNVETTVEGLMGTGLDKEKATWIAESAHYYFNPEIVELYMKLARVSPRDLIRGYFDDERAGAKAILGGYEAWIGRFKQLGSTMYSFNHTSSRDGAIANLKKKLDETEGPLPDADLAMLQGLLFEVKNFERAFAKDSPLKTDLKFDAKELEKKKGSREKFLKDANARLEEVVKNENDQINFCMANYVLQRELVPTKEELDLLVKRITKTKTALAKAFGKKVSSHTRKGLKEAIENFEMYLPPTRDTVGDRFENSLGRRQESFRNSHELMNSTDEKVSGPLSKIFYNIVLLSPNNKDAGGTICKDVYMDPFPDGLIANKGIQVGPTTATMDDESSTSILMHELGHMLSHRFTLGLTSKSSAGKYRKVRECLRDLQPPSLSARRNETASSETYEVGALTEEDFADWVAGMAQGKLKSNPWCDLMPSAPGGDGFAVVTAKPKDRDPHSADLFRLLHREVLRGNELPESCKLAVASTHGEDAIKVCEM